MIKNNKNEGNVLMIVFLIIAAFGIMIPSIVNFVKNEARWSVKERKQTEAFHLAEAAHDRGHWKLCESTANWTTIVSGATIAGYANDVVYSDVSGGYYKINIYRISATSVGILATAKDSAGAEFRAIRAIYSKVSVAAAVQAPSFASSGNCTVWWGPLYSMGNIDLGSGASNNYYPRKMARGSISGAGTLGDRDTSVSIPNTDPGTKKEWWSYNTYPVPDMPTVDTAYYKAQAITAGTYYTTANYDFGDPVDAAPKIRYCEAGCKIKGNSTFMQGYLIVFGDCELTAKGSGSYSTLPPSEGWKEYVKNVPTDSTTSTIGDTTAQDQYPGDGGYQTVKAYTIGSGLYGGGNKNVAFKGFIYCTGSFSSGANTVMHGAVVISTGGAFGGGGAELWFDSTISVQTSSSVAGSRQSWVEEVATPF
ncbi:MAG: hypothetical protein A2452_02660 [Candidatus Firestonebacteria bacterium RIFOXYC2_FULL_39_67]|nr:MAG: hypothetical protein A2452_02660 [Candidatus Firestonebacteria bacterium RIFOXYC2_FULL_39_67]OGF57799.1 MAG: hypothetical protein A2497_03040 [Candidatus Firestonebacteria bacterium RifOxyC12_full_39_7]